MTIILLTLPAAFVTAYMAYYEWETPLIISWIFFSSFLTAVFYTAYLT